MELKEAIEILKSLQLDRKSFIEDEAEHNSIFMQDYEAIETVLQALDNSISKDKIKEKIEELKEATQEALSECGSASKEFTICVYQEAVLEELLKGE